MSRLRRLLLLSAASPAVALADLASLLIQFLCFLVTLREKSDEDHERFREQQRSNVIVLFVNLDRLSRVVLSLLDFAYLDLLDGKIHDTAAATNVMPGSLPYQRSTG